MCTCTLLSLKTLPLLNKPRPLPVFNQTELLDPKQKALLQPGTPVLPTEKIKQFLHGDTDNFYMPLPSD